MKRIDSLLDKDLHLVERRKTIFLIPLGIVVVAAIMMIIFNFTLGSPLYLGTDFAGGFSVSVGLGSKLTDENYQEYCDKIEAALTEVPALEGDGKYNVRVDNMQKQGSGSTSTIRVKCFALKGVTEAQMSDEVFPAIRNTIDTKVLGFMPTIDFSDDGKKITLTYSEVVQTPDFEDLREAFAGKVIDVLNNGTENIVISGDAVDAVTRNEDNKKQIIIACESVNATDGVRRALAEGMKLVDMGDNVEDVGFTGATVSSELIFTAVLAVVLALIFMLCYIGLRFQLSSGIACILALFHDIIIMVCAMAICRIEINSTFIAALITILGYSINNSIIVFDRVRENMKSSYAKNMSAEDIANKSVKETLLRSINTTITTLIMIGMIAIIGVRDIRIFAFPIIIGLFAGTFSSIFIAPSLWALFQRIGKKGDKNMTAVKPEKKTEKTPVQA